MSNPTTIFETVPLEPRSFFQKLFRQQPPGNAVREVNNLLATTPLLSITRQNIVAVEQTYGLSLLNEYQLNIEEFYAVYLASCLSDSAISDEETAALNQLQTILGLTDEAVQKLREMVGESAYRAAFGAAIADGRFSIEETNALEHLQQTLRLPVTLTDTISQELRGQYISRLLDTFKAKARLSPLDEKEWQVVLQNLGYGIRINNDDQVILGKLKRYWALENLPLEIIEPDTDLQKGEVCYLFVNNTSWLENGRQVDKGTLHVTNKRILLTGLQKNSNIRLEKIISVTTNRDGVFISKDAGKSPTLALPVQQDDFVILLNRLLK